MRLRTSRLPRLALCLILVAGLGCSPDEEASAETDHVDRMAEEHAGDTAEPSPAAIEPERPVDAREVTYATIDGREVRGYLAAPRDAAADVPGILVIHEWWGLNDNIRTMAERLAGEGYRALAVDLYAGESADTPERARELMQASTERSAELEENLRRAQRYLESEGSGSIGVVGWCFGGGWALRTGLLIPDAIDAVVMYYGRPITDEQELAALEAPLLGIFGAEDGGIPVDTVRELEAALDGLGKRATIEIFPGVGHAFANPSGNNYQPEAAERAWTMTLDFFRRQLEGGA